jgi:homocysteine S-methyltransferase
MASDDHAIIVLDGAMATQLAARGFDLCPPLFGARALLDAPELVEAIHRDYLLAGAQVLTANSFGLHASILAQAGIAEQQGALARRSVEILGQVRAASPAEARRFRIAGSISPRPQNEAQTHTHDELARAEYRGYAQALVDAGVDLILLETFTSLDEARLALAGLAGIELPIWLSVAAGAPVPGSNRPDGARLVGGEPLAGLAELDDRVDALLVNCTQIDAVPGALRALPALRGLSPHLGKRRHDGVWIDRIVEAEVFAEQIQAWIASRPQLSLVGACCGSGPEDIAALRARLQPDEAARERGWTALAALVP